MLVVIRADASASIGTGHVMRCLAVAESLIENGARALFAAVDMPDALRRRLDEAGAGLADLPGPPGGDGDLAATAALAATAVAVIIDGYCFDETYRRRLRAACKGPVTTFDDTADLDNLYADIVVNAAPDANKLGYADKAPGARLLLGPAFAPLRRDVRKAAALPRLDWGARDRILLTFGGSDPLGLTGPVMARLLELLPPGVGVDVAVGAANPRVEALRALAALLGPRVVLHVDCRDMGGLMRRAGLAAAAAGGTVGELAALGAPTLLVVAADNQAPAAASAAGAGLMVVEARGGDVPAAAGLIAQAAADLWRDPDRRRALAQALDGAVDGQGASRIAAAVLAFQGDGATCHHKM